MNLKENHDSMKEEKHEANDETPLLFAFDRDNAFLVVSLCYVETEQKNQK